MATLESALMAPGALDQRYPPSRLASALMPTPAQAAPSAFTTIPPQMLAEQQRPVVNAGPSSNALAEALMASAYQSPNRNWFEAVGNLAKLWSGSRQNEKFAEAQSKREAEAAAAARQAGIEDYLLKKQIDQQYAEPKAPNVETFYDAEGRAQPGIYDPSAPGGFRPVGNPKAPSGDDAGAAPGFKDVASLRKEIQDLPSYKNVSQALPIYKSMVATAGNDSKASDLNLVYGLSKMFDPGSVVREGEMVLVQNAAGLPDWLRGYINSLNGGAGLTPETRRMLLTEAKNRMDSYMQSYDQDATQFKALADRYRINPEDVIFKFGDVPAWPPKRVGPDFSDPAYGMEPAGKAPAVGTVEDGYRFKGGDPSDPKNWERLVL